MHPLNNPNYIAIIGRCLYQRLILWIKATCIELTPYWILAFDGLCDTIGVSGYVSHESGFSKRVLQPSHVCRESFSRTRHLIDINETTRCAWVALARSRSRARARARAYVIDYSQRGYHPYRVLLLAQADAHACAISRALACPWNYNGRQPVPTAVRWCTYAAIPSNAGDNDAELNEATQIRVWLFRLGKSPTPTSASLRHGSQFMGAI